MKKLLLSLSLLAAFGLQAQPFQTQADRDLLEAALYDNLYLLQSALEGNANLDTRNEDNETALHEAILYESTAIATILVKHTPIEIDARDDNGCTPLHAAAGMGNTALVALLIDNGAEIDALDNDDRTPLQLAAENYNEDAVSLLLNHGADQYRVNDEGWSADDIFTGKREGNDCCRDCCDTDCSDECSDDCDERCF